jgi:hypothetical protein
MRKGEDLSNDTIFDPCTFSLDYTFTLTRNCCDSFAESEDRVVDGPLAPVADQRQTGGNWGRGGHLYVPV